MALLVLLPGCAVLGPDYRAPELPVPVAYQAPLPAYSVEPGSLADWWRGFDDPMLASLIEQGIEANLDLAVAENRVLQARTQLRRAVAATRPSADLGGGASAGADNAGAGMDITGSADVGFDTGWEADLFGGLRRSIEAAEAGSGAAAERRRAVLVSLAAEIGTAYVDLRGAQRRLALARQSLDTQRGTLALVVQQRDAGVASELDVIRARSSVNSLQAQIPGIEAEIQQAINRLSVLLAQPPGALTDALAELRPIPVVVAGPDVGLPADLLRRRPDLREAERNLAQATAEIGVAVADLYPRLRLPGSLSFGLSGFGAGSVVDRIAAALSASLSLPLFDGGARQAAVDQAELAAGEALLTYRQTLLVAMEEVEAALIDYAEARERREALRRALAQDQQAYQLATTLYEEGLISFIDVLDAQRTLTSTRQDLARADTELSARLIALYRALGGGWGGPEAEPML